MAHQLHDGFVRRCSQDGRYNISVDDLIPVALVVDKAIHVPHRLSAKHLKFKGFLHAKRSSQAAIPQCHLVILGGQLRGSVDLSCRITD
jgi:hypothetical protein